QSETLDRTPAVPAQALALAGLQDQVYETRLAEPPGELRQQGVQEQEAQTGATSAADTPPAPEMEPHPAGVPEAVLARGPPVAAAFATIPTPSRLVDTEDRVTPAPAPQAAQDPGVLSAQELAPLIAEAKREWSASGLIADRLALLDHMT